MVPIETAELLVRDAESFFHQNGSSPVASALVRVAGIWLEDSDGGRLIDLHGNSVHHLGHAHPRLIAALKRQLDDLPFCPRRYTNAPVVALAERLRQAWPDERPTRVLFATGGSDAIEIALRLCRVATGRSDVVAFEGSYHGHGMGALALSSASLDRRFGPRIAGIRHVTPYWTDAAASLAEIEDALSPGTTACFVAEAMRSSCIVPPAGFWRDVRRLCTRYGTKLVFDEIPSGLGKTGRFFAFEHFGIVPDAAVLGKSLGGGIVPIAAVIAEAALDVAPELAIGHYTHEKNPFTARAALTTLEIIADEKLVEKASALGEFTLTKLRALAAINPHIAGGRGLGLMLAIELAGENSATKARRLAAIASRHGISTVTKPGSAIGFSPALIISRDEAALAIDKIAAATLELP